MFNTLTTDAVSVEEEKSLNDFTLTCVGEVGESKNRKQFLLLERKITLGLYNYKRY